MLNSILLTTVLIGTVLGELIPRFCDECVPILRCPAAMKWINVTNEETTKKLQQAYCGSSDNASYLICCSDFKTPEVQEHPNSKLLPSFCGSIYYSRLLGGLGITLYELPWMALISHMSRDGLQFKCSGTIINKHYILTSASCVVGKNVAGVRIGEYDIEQEYDCVGDVCESSIQDKRIEAPIVHPGYEGPPNYAHDIALLRVQGAIDFSFKNAGPICLPLTKELISESIENKSATIAGWGLSEYGQHFAAIHKETVTVFSDNNCQNLYRYENSTRICAGNDNKDSCVSDIGGPLMIQTGHEHNPKCVQYGIMSIGSSPCGSDSPGIYTDVRKYLNWILDNIKE